MRFRKPKYEIIEDNDKLIRIFESLSGESTLFLAHLTDKTETVGGGARMLAFGTCDKHYIVYSKEIGEKNIAESMKPVINNEDITIISHNIKELYAWMFEIWPGFKVPHL